MSGLLIVNGFLKSRKFDELTDIFISAAKRLGEELIVKKNSDYPVYTGKSTLSFDKNPDYVIFFDKDILLAKWFELKKIPVYNSSEAIAICDDKRRTHLALLEAGVVQPDTVFAPMTYDNVGYEDVGFIHEVIEKLGFPFILKEAYGSFGEQVHMISSMLELIELLGSLKRRDASGMGDDGDKKNKLSGHHILFQKYIQSSYGRDIRLQVVGDEVVAAMERRSTNDFRANITSGGRMYPYEPSYEECELAKKAARATGCVYAGVDLLFGEGDERFVCEVNSNAHFKNLMDISGVDVAEKILLNAIKM